MHSRLLTVAVLNAGLIYRQIVANGKTITFCELERDGNVAVTAHFGVGHYSWCVFLEEQMK